MGREFGQDWRNGLASALEWWRDAGVDTLIEDEPRDWLARPVAQRADAVEEAAPAAFIAAPLPDTLEAFLAWRMGDEAPEAEWLTPRIGPVGDPGAPLMVLTDMPESEDAATGTLLSGSAGRLFDRILAAIGESRESVYLAPFAFARPLTGQIPGEQEARLTELAQHHIALVAPKQLLILGDAAKRVRSTTSGSDFGNGEAVINHFVRNVEAVAVRAPRFLLGQPAAKAEAWKQLIQFSKGDRP
jgi:DNA polymerase